jgi:hypothetical protein
MASRRTLLRQRRFLVLISLAVAGYYVLKVHLKAEAQYSGFAVILLHPERVSVCLWVVFGWALWRYLQCLNAVWQRVRVDLHRDVDFEDQQLALKAMRRCAIRTVARGDMREKFPDETKPRVVGGAWIQPSIKQMIRETRPQAGSAAKPKPDPGFAETDAGGRKYRSFGIAVSAVDKEGLRISIGQDFDMPPWSRWRTRIHRARAWARAAMRLPALFEHLAPLGMALAAVLVAIVCVWFDNQPPEPL